MKKREYRTLILAGLLHDVGKLLVRDPRERKRAREVTRSQTGRKSSAHWILGEDFLRRDGIGDRLSAFDIDLDLLCFAVRWHHHYFQKGKAEECLEALGKGAESYRRVRDCIVKGDGLSASERSERAKAKIDFALGLQSIFANLNIGRKPEGDMLRYRPEVLSPEIAFPAEFPPGASREARAFGTRAYEPLVSQFKEGFRYALENANDSAELEAWIYSLLERYAWAIPSDMHTRAEPRDVSLFDHERTTCAIAATVYIWRGLAPAEERDKTRFLFIKGDVSGVQDYIYSVANIGPGGVAKRLRARSFFITALTEVVAHWLREELVPGYPLPIAAQILGGGGQFVMLAPDLIDVHDRLQAIEHEVNDWLWRELQGDIAITFGTATATESELGLRAKRTVCDVLDELEREVAEVKRHRLSVLLQDKGDWVENAFLWAPENKTFKDGVCPSCDRLPARAGEGASVDDRLCPRCFWDRVLSERIVEAKYIAYYKGASPPEPKAEVELKEAERLRNSRLVLFGGMLNKSQDDQGDVPTITPARYVVLLKNLDDMRKLTLHPYQLDGFGYEAPTPQGPALVRHFANYVPRWKNLEDLVEFCTSERACVEGNHRTCGIRVRPTGSEVEASDFPILQTFGCVSAASAESLDGQLGSQLLGVLRADVDYLGRLFRDGLGEVKSLSRMATLSRMTDLFFSGWVHYALENGRDRHYDRIYTVYSGGDDLCLVGPWDVIIDFAQYMAAQFEKYVAGNPNVTLSAAIAVTKPKFPIAKAARRAGEYLDDRAKGEGRARLHLFGTTAAWKLGEPAPQETVDVIQLLGQPDMPETVKETKVTGDWAAFLDRQLTQAEKNPRYPFSTSTAHRLLRYAEMCRRWQADANIHALELRWLSQLEYDLARNIKPDDFDDLRGELEDAKARLRELGLDKRDIMGKLRMPITWALLKHRRRGE
jgi:CRISPR-associated protein Csm1